MPTQTKTEITAHDGHRGQMAYDSAACERCRYLLSIGLGALEVADDHGHSVGRAELLHDQALGGRAPAPEKLDTTMAAVEHLLWLAKENSGGEGRQELAELLAAVRKWRGK